MGKKKNYSPDIMWKTMSVRLGDLVEWDKNPRQLSSKDGVQLEKSLTRFGQADPLIVNADGKSLIGGHQRRRILLAKYGAEIQVDVRFPSRNLSPDELSELAIRLNRNTGEWDWDALANNFDTNDLLEWGFDKYELRLDDEEDSISSSEDNIYSRKVETPIYTIKGDKPKIIDLYNDKRALELLDEIKNSQLPDDEKHFLELAAYRHIVIDFEKVAEYYAHSNSIVQRLMENNALVIIDFRRAIELGYVKLTEQIKAQYQEDYGIE